MIRLKILVEGVTEETFVRSILVEHLAKFQVFADACRVQTSRQRGVKYSGGGLSYDRVKRELLNWMKQDATARFTTMFDLYRLHDSFPGYEEARRIADPFQRVRALEAGFAADIRDPRFIPYFQLHEFEALVLTDPRALLSEFPAALAQIDRLVQDVAAFSSPELVDDRPEAAPCARIIATLPAYRGRKAQAGPSTAGRIGLAAIRKACPHFHEWLHNLESLGEAAGR